MNDYIPVSSLHHIDVSDDDLWDILKWRPRTKNRNPYIINPSDYWVKWAKRELTSGKEPAEPLFLCRVLRVALSFFSSFQRTIFDHFNKDSGIREDFLRHMFADCEVLCGIDSVWREEYSSVGNVLGTYYPNFIDAYCRCRNSHLSITTEYNTNYISLGFKGKRELRQLYGSVPDLEDDNPFGDYLNEELPTGSVNGNSSIQVPLVIQSVSKSDATAIGTGGSVSLNINEGAVQIAPIVEKGAVKLEANPTINVASPDLVGMRAKDAEIERIRQEHETERTRILAEALTGKAEAPSKNDTGKRNPQLSRDEVTQKEVATDTGVTVRTVQKWETGEIAAPDGYPRRASRVKYVAWLEGWRMTEQIKKEGRARAKPKRVNPNDLDGYEEPTGKHHKKNIRNHEFDE